MTTLEKRKIEASQKWKEAYSRSGILVIESAVKQAKESGRSSLQLKDIALVLPQEETIQKILRKLNLDPEKIQASLKSGLNNRPIEEDLWTGSNHNTSIVRMISAAQKESQDGNASKIRAGDIMVAIWESPTSSGKALREALSPAQQKGVSFLTQLRSIVDVVDKPSAA